ncbi:MAG: hypothetical protein HY421_01915 [Candidatus Kerfeldbacteria bacterium]|nr:hypothetical protein [Candidatus Kerfeldbacteria bacterium]
MAKKNQSVPAKKKSGKAKKLAKLALLAGAIYGAKKLWDAQQKKQRGPK